MKVKRNITVFFLLLMMAVCASYAADLTVVPETIDTGVSNITTVFTIGTPSSAGVAWTAAPDYAGHPAWFVLGATSGAVHSLSSDSVPLAIRRDALPALGTYTGCVIVAGGDTARTVTVVTALTESDNGMFPRIGGDARAYAGMPYLLDARASMGWIGAFYWVTNYTTNVSVEVQALSTGPVGDMVFDEPDEFDLSLVSKDEHERTTIDTKPSFRVWNSPPRVSCGGPYRALAGDTVTVVAVGIDPNPNEKLLYSWQFDPPDGPFTAPSESPTATFVYTHTHDSFIICVVSDTWTGASGTYNGPLGGQGIARIVASNQPPSVEVAYLSNGVWTAWSNRHDVAWKRLPATGFAMKAEPFDPDGQPACLTVEWREDPANPTHNLISDADATNVQVTLEPMTKPGRYHFTVVANDGDVASPAADVFVTVPGIRCDVVVEGFQTKIPVWGAGSSTHPANTNAYGVHDDTLATRSDIDGWTCLDRPLDSHCFVELERTVDAEENERASYYFTTSTESNFHGEQTFEFPATLYPYGGRLVDADDHEDGVPYADATLIIHSARVSAQCNVAGGYSFGNLPKAWPMDSEETGSYYVVFLKEGWSSLCVKRTPAQVNARILNDLHVLQETNATVVLSGTVRSSVSGLPLGGARVWFANSQETADGDGQFSFTNLPLPCTMVPQAPTHVLIAEADGCTPTRNIYHDTAEGGTVDVYIDGGETYLYGRVFDAATGEPITNGTVETPVGEVLNAQGKKASKTAFVSVSVPISKSSHFSICVPCGCDYVTIDARGASQEVPVTRGITGTQPVGNDIAFVPEHTSFVLISMFAAAVVSGRFKT